AVFAAHNWILSGENPRGRTLGGCRFARRPNGMLLIAREDAAVPRERVPLEPDVPLIWDGRFRVSVRMKPDLQISVGPLGAKCLALAGPKAKLRPVERGLIARPPPALWTGGRLLAAPLLEYCAEEMGGVPLFVAFLGLGQR